MYVNNNNNLEKQMEYRVIELLQEIKSLIIGQPKKEKWLDINKASRYCDVSAQTLRRNIKNPIIIKVIEKKL